MKGVPRFLRFLLVLFVSGLLARADASLASARLAQRLLGGETWSQVIRVENEGRSRRYPRIVHALVFELAGILWFYTATDGTQSFSLHRGRLAAEKADFAPLLRDIDAGFTRWTVLPAAPTGPIEAGPLANGCFIESVAALRDQLADGVAVLRPQLLSYYVPRPGGVLGHTVLAFETRGRVRVIDPAQPRASRDYPLSLAADPLELARLVGGPRIATARWVPIEDWSWRTRVAESRSSAGETPRRGA